MASLEAIQKTNIVRVPQPIKVIDLPGGGAMFVMEYLKMKHLNKYVCTFLFLFTIFWGIFSYILQSVRKLHEKNLSVLSKVEFISVKIHVCVYVYILKKKATTYLYICVYTLRHVLLFPDPLPAKEMACHH